MDWSWNVENKLHVCQFSKGRNVCSMQKRPTALLCHCFAKLVYDHCMIADFLVYKVGNSKMHHSLKNTIITRGISFSKISMYLCGRNDFRTSVYPPKKLTIHNFWIRYPNPTFLWIGTSFHLPTRPTY